MGRRSQSRETPCSVRRFLRNEQSLESNGQPRPCSEKLQGNPEVWEQYHTLYRKARESWPVVPFQEFIRGCESREGYVIADFGCGEALIAQTVKDKDTVHSFDHVAIDDSVIEGEVI